MLPSSVLFLIKVLVLIVLFPCQAQRTIRGKTIVNEALDSFEDFSIQIASHYPQRGIVVLRSGGDLILGLQIVDCSIGNEMENEKPLSKRNVKISRKTFELLFPMDESFGNPASASVHWMHYPSLSVNEVPLGIITQLPQIDTPYYTSSFPIQYAPSEGETDFEYVAMIALDYDIPSYLYPFYCILVDGPFGSVSVRIVSAFSGNNPGNSAQGNRIMLSQSAFEKVALNFIGTKVVWKIAPCPRTTHGPVNTPPPMDRRGIAQLDSQLPTEESAFYASLSREHMIPGISNDQNPLFHPNACIRVFVPANGRELTLKIAPGDEYALSEINDIGLSHAAYAYLLTGEIEVLEIDWNFIPCNSDFKSKKRSLSGSSNEGNCSGSCCKAAKSHSWQDQEVYFDSNEFQPYQENLQTNDSEMREEVVADFSLFSSLDNKGIAFSFPLEVSIEGIYTCANYGFPITHLPSDHLVALPINSHHHYNHQRFCDPNNQIKIEGPFGCIMAKFVGFFQADHPEKLLLSTKAFEIIAGTEKSNEAMVKWSLISNRNATSNDSLISLAHHSQISPNLGRNFGFCGPSILFSRWEWVVASVPMKYLEVNGEFLCGPKGFIEVTDLDSGRKLTCKVVDVWQGTGTSSDLENEIALSPKACLLLKGEGGAAVCQNQIPFQVKWKFVVV